MYYNLNDKAYPDIYAVDPEDCGCTECIVKEYVPYHTWCENALPGDIHALLTGTIRNNVGVHLRNITVLDIYNYRNQDTRHYLEKMYDLLLSDERIHEEAENLH